MAAPEGRAVPSATNPIGRKALVTTHARPTRRRTSASTVAIALALLALSAALIGCARVEAPLSGRTSTETREPGSFTAVSVADAIQLHVAIGSPASVSVTADLSVLPFVITDVHAGELVVAIDGANLASNGVRVDIVVPALAGVSATSSAEATVDDLKVDGFAIQTASSADVRVTGSVASLRLRASSSSEIDASDATIGTAQVELGSAAHARVHASDLIEGSVSESAELVVVGQPQVQVAVNSSGRIIRR